MLGMSVSTLAEQRLVESTQNAGSTTTGPYAFVVQVMKETHMKYVKNVSVNAWYLFFPLSITIFLYLTAGCKSDDECPQHLACIRRECQDPCRFERCGQNAQCSVRNHRAKCDCLPGYRGNPYEICRQYECLTDPECPTTKACRNEKCVDPCDCAINAHCTPRNHRGICACDSGYTGDPYGIECTKSKSKAGY